MARANILIASAQVPFTRGGAEVLVETLRRELGKRDYNVDVVQLPFSAQPKEVLAKQLALWRSLDLQEFNGNKVDLLIATKFPSYAAYHPNKVVWLVHQHRQIYELYGSRFGDFAASSGDEALRRTIVNADRRALGESSGLFTISGNVSDRLKRYLDLDAEVLFPPLPLGSRYQTAAAEDYILSVGRLCSIKRVDLLIRALPRINSALKAKVVGVADEPAIERYFQSEVEKHHLWDRIEFLGRVSEEELLSLYAKSFAVYYAPYDEDYGFVTLEALASGKPVVTAKDSGGVLAFVEDRKNGLIAEPNENGIANAFNELFLNRSLYDSFCSHARLPEEIVSWDEVTAALTRTITHED